MKITIICSHGARISDLDEHLPEDTDEIIITGGRTAYIPARKYAIGHDIRLTEVFPDYKKDGQSADMMCNIRMIDGSDMLLIFGDTVSSETGFAVDYCRISGKAVKIIEF